MDNLCHTLAGGALARTGLARRTALGTATLLLGANLPDVDAAALFFGPTVGLELRRGWTHGVLALVVWPFALAGTMLLWDRWVRRRRRPGAVPAHARSLLLLAAVGVASHPLLDTLNTYGVRWLMPFSPRWFYGDTLFIVDPWVWLALGFGMVMAGRRWRGGLPHAARPALVAILLVATYTAGMRAITATAMAVARADLEARHGEPVGRLLASPVPVLPLTRQIVAAVPGGYRVGSVRWRPGPRFEPAERGLIPFGPLADPDVQRAAVLPEGRRFLGWARFPYVAVERGGGSTVVHFVDARYALRPGARFGAVRVELPPPGMTTVLRLPGTPGGTPPPGAPAAGPGPRP